MSDNLAYLTYFFNKPPISRKNKLIQLFCLSRYNALLIILLIKSQNFTLKTNSSPNQSFTLFTLLIILSLRPDHNQLFRALFRHELRDIINYQPWNHPVRSDFLFWSPFSNLFHLICHFLQSFKPQLSPKQTPSNTCVSVCVTFGRNQVLNRFLELVRLDSKMNSI